MLQCVLVWGKELRQLLKNGKLGGEKMSNVLLKTKERIAYVTINRPEVLNCFNYSTLLELERVIEDLSMNHDIWAVVITGSGEKAFSAGADLKERRQLGNKEVIRNVKKISSVFEQVANLPQPTIALINGYALGGGLELALACDFRIAVSYATMGLTETSMGIIPGAGGTQRLPRLIGQAKAMEFILTAKQIYANEALEYGLVHQVVEQEELFESCELFVKSIVRMPQIAIRQAKFAIQQGMDTDLKTGIKIEESAYHLTIPTKDRVEALTAFYEKRSPKFIGE